MELNCWTSKLTIKVIMFIKEALMMLLNAVKPELDPQERSMSIAKYYDLPFHTLDPVRMQILNAGPIDPAKITPPDRITDLIRLEGYVPGSDYGYCMLEDGSGFVATYNVFHNCTMEMLKWWFSWMNTKAANQPEGTGNIKYKVWCPYGHFDHGIAMDGDGRMVPRAAEALDLTLNGDPVDNIYMHDVDPALLGLSRDQKDKLDAAGVIYGTSYETFDYPGMHLCMSMMRPCPTGGIEAFGREWMGYGVRDGRIVREPGTPVDEAFLKKVVIHCSCEMQHLDQILPALYAEYKDTPANAPL